MSARRPAANPLSGPARLCRLSALISAALCLGPVAPVHAEPVDDKAIDAAVRQALKAWHVPGVAVAVVRGDEVVYLKGHGVRTAGRDAPVTPDTLFPIASCTKAFTTTAMAILVDEGKMGWDDPVREHVPFFRLSDPLADREVRLRDLVCHRTGLAGHDLLWYRAPWSQEESIRRAGHLPLDQPFRSTFQYQSTMVNVAGFAVAHAAGMPWADFVQKRVFDPLGMKDACFTTTAAARCKDRASPHKLNGHGSPQVVPFYPMPLPDPAGSIQANARDLAKWVRFQLGDGTARKQRIVSAKNLAETHTPQMVIRMDDHEREIHPYTSQMSYGMGWVIMDHRGYRLLAHAGATDGFRAHVALVPRAKVGVVLLCNLRHTRMNLALSNSILDIVLGLPRKDWNARTQAVLRKADAEEAEKERAVQAGRRRGTHPSRDLAAYAGSYDNPAYGTATVSVEDGVLVWHWGNFSGRLEHFHYDTFVLPIELMGRPHVVFTLDADGNVARMKVLGKMNVEFRRKKRGRG